MEAPGIDLAGGEPVVDEVEHVAFDLEEMACFGEEAVTFAVIVVG